MKRYAYAWITATFFLVSIALHWIFGWFAFVDESMQHGEQAQASAYREYLRTHGHALPHGHDSELARHAGSQVKHVASG